MIALIATVMLAIAAGVTADAAVTVAAASLNTVINNIRNWLAGLLVALATVLLTIGGC